MLKKVFYFCISSILAISLVACGSTPAATDTSSDTSDTATTDKKEDKKSSTGKTKLRVVFRDDGIGEDAPLYRWMAKAYETYPKKDEIELDIAPITASEGDYFAKVALSLQSPDTAPDIVTEDTFQLATDVSAGYLAPLDDMLVNYPAWTDGSYIESLKAGVSGADGQVYAIPYTSDSRGLWYNKDIFKQAGLSEDWNPKSWQEILDTCAILKEKVPDVIPFWCNSAIATGEATSMQTYEMLLYGTGTGERLIENDKWVVSSPQILQSLEFLETIYKEGYGPPLAIVLNGQASNMSAREYLPEGKLAISLDGSWITGNYQPEGASPWPEYKDVLGFAPMPTSEGQDPGTITLAGGWGLAVPEKSSNKEAAFEFIQYLMEPENYVPAIIEIGGLSTRTDSLESPEYASRPFLETSSKFLEESAFRPQNDNYPNVSTHIQTMVESVVSGNTPQAAMDQYAADVTNAVGKENVISK